MEPVDLVSTEGSLIRLCFITEPVGLTDMWGHGVDFVEGRKVLLLWTQWVLSVRGVRSRLRRVVGDPLTTGPFTSSTRKVLTQPRHGV